MFIMARVHITLTDRGAIQSRLGRLRSRDELHGTAQRGAVRACVGLSVRSRDVNGSGRTNDQRWIMHLERGSNAIRLAGLLPLW